MKISLPISKPRNPMVVATLRRQAGVHMRCRSALRQQNKRELQRELLRERSLSP